LAIFISTQRLSNDNQFVEALSIRWNMVHVLDNRCLKQYDVLNSPFIELETPFTPW